MTKQRDGEDAFPRPETGSDGQVENNFTRRRALSGAANASLTAIIGTSVLSACGGGEGSGGSVTTEGLGLTRFPIPGGQPTFTTPPTISHDGSPAIGELLTGNDGQINNGTVMARQWLIGGTPIPGATGSTYVPVAAGDHAYQVTAGSVKYSVLQTTNATSAAVTVAASDPLTANRAWHSQSSGATNTFAHLHNGTDLSMGASFFGPICGTNCIGSRNTDENIVSFGHSAGTFSKASTIVAQQTSTDKSRWYLRRNGVRGLVVVVNPGIKVSVNSAAIYSDPTNEQAIADGDALTWELAVDPTTTAAPGVVNPAVGGIFAALSAPRKLTTFYNPVGVNYSTSANRFLSFTGYNNQVSADCGVPMPQAVTLDRAQIRLSVAGSGAKAARISLDNVPQTGPGSITVPLTAMGLVSDPTNVQAVAKGQTACWVLQGTGAVPRVDSGAIGIVSAIPARIPMLTQSPSPVTGNSREAFFNLDHTMRRNNVEGESRNPVPVAGSMSDLFVRITANTAVAGTSLNLRRLAAGSGPGAGIDTALMVAIPANSGPAIVSDPTNIVALNANDAICWRLPADFTASTSLIAVAASFEAAA